MWRRLITVAGVVVATLAAVILPSAMPQPRTHETVVDVAAAMSRVCPVVDPAFAPTQVLAANMSGTVTTRELAPDAQAAPVASGPVSVIDKPANSVELEVAAAGRGAASTLSAQDSGLEKGLAASSCVTATNTAWFPVAESSDGATTTLYLSAIDDSGATVDVTLYGPKGRVDVAGTRSLTVRPHATSVLALSGLVTRDGPIAVHVTASSGRVAAVARVRQLGGDAASPGRGTDWEPSAVAPTTTLTVPGLPAGDGDRTLSVVNPNDRIASFTYSFVGSDGVDEGTRETVTVPAEGIATIPVDGVTRGRAGALVVKADRPVTAAVRAAAGSGDFALLPAQAPARGTFLVPVAQENGRATVQLTSAGAAKVEISATDGDGHPLGTPTSQSLAAGRTVTVDLPAGPKVVAAVKVTGGDVTGGVVLTRDMNGFAGLTWYPLSPDEGGRAGTDAVDGQALR